MATVADVARNVASLLQIDENLLLIGTWVSYRWQEVAHSHTLRVLRRVGELTTVAPEVAGTVTVNEGSRVVAGSGTAFSQAHVGRHFRTNGAWHQIESVQMNDQIMLVSPYAGADQVGADYSIVKRYYEVDPATRHLGTFTNQERRVTLDPVSVDGLDLSLPGRYSVGDNPQWVAELHPDEERRRRVEIYPYPKSIQLIHYLYWIEAPVLEFNDPLPPQIDVEALTEGVMIDAMRYMMGKEARKGNVEMTAFWRNEYRAQETRWREHRTRILSQDAGSNDLEIILSQGRAHPQQGPRRITTARDEVWSRQL